MDEPVTEKGRRAKQVIVKSAAELVHSQSIAETHVADVLAACNMGKSQFYHYFADKDELLKEVVRYRAETLFREVYLRPLDKVHSVAALRSWMRNFGEMAVQKNYCMGCPAGNIAMQLDTSEQDLRLDITDAFDGVNVSLVAALERIQARGQLAKGVNIEATATYIVGVFQGALALSRIYQDPGRLRIVLHEAQQYLKQLSV